MKKSINAWSFPAEFSFAECIERAKSEGFDAIEFNLDGKPSPHAFTLDSTDAEITAVRELMAANGIGAVSVSSSMHGGIWATDDPATLDYAKRVLAKQLRIATLLGAGAILLVPGGMKDGITLKESRANSIKNLKAVEPMIRESGIKVGLENVWNGFFLSPYDMVSFLDELDSDCFGLYFDLGNMVAFSDSAFWCEIVGSRSVRIHVKDYKRNGGINSGGTWVNLLRGDLDFPRAMAALKATGFDGYLTAEVFKSADESFESFLHDVSTAEDEIIGYYNAV